MATATMTRAPGAVQSGKPVKVFTSKRARKAYRKGLIRNFLANKLADRAIVKESKRDFYRRLRMMKIHRHQVTRVSRDIVAALDEVNRQVVRLVDRYRVDGAGIEEVLRVLTVAATEATKFSHACDAFARQRIQNYYLASGR